MNPALNLPRTLVLAALSMLALAGPAPATGLEVTSGSPADIEELLRRDIERYRRIILLTGARPDEQR